VNYYERHIGDYLKDTAHLSLLEHGVYTRLMDVYYTRECAIPALDVARLVGARSKDEKEALQAVLSEFFQLTDGAHAQDRCDREIARFKDKQAKAKRSADARWSKPETQTDGNADALPNAMRTHSEGNAPRARPQTPVTSNQEPPISPQGGKKSSPVGLKAWLEAVKTKGEKAIPDDDPVIAYAEKVGIPQVFLRLAWFEFCHRYGQPDAKRYRDWRAVFRKAVQGNWLKLWFLDAASNEYGLTTVGHQAQRAHDDRRAA